MKRDGVKIYVFILQKMYVQFCVEDNESEQTRCEHTIRELAEPSLDRSTCVGV